MSPKQVKPQGNDKDKKENGKDNKSGMAAKIVGAVLVVGGLLLIGALVVMFLLTRLPYRTDSDLPVPTLEELDEYTNSKELTIEGENVPGEKVVLYVNDKRQNETVETNEDGEFKFEDVEVEEGDYEFEATTVTGRLWKKQSQKSNTVETTVDRTSPSAEVELDYEEETESSRATIKGEAEEGAFVVLEGEDKEYEVKTDEKGKFEVKDVELEEGENTFKVKVTDEAGNTTEATEDIKIVAQAGEDGDLNGPGVTTQAGENGEIPESSGELSEAIEEIMQNNVMVVFGVLSLIVLAISSTGAVIYNRNRVK